MKIDTWVGVSESHQNFGARSSDTPNQGLLVEFGCAGGADGVVKVKVENCVVRRVAGREKGAHGA